MAIRAIDAQIMVNRTSDFAKDSAVNQKRGETTQEYIAIHEKAMAQQDQKKVAKPAEAEKARLNLKGDGKGSGGASRNGGKRKEKESETEDTELVLPSEHILDIKA